jgi:hypothetical protein
VWSRARAARSFVEAEAIGIARASRPPTSRRIDMTGTDTRIGQVATVIVPVSDQDASSFLIVRRG